jgi:hypothetical protein
VSIGYSAMGSSAGIAAFSAGQVNFGASDVPMTAAEQAPPKAGPLPRCPSTWAAKASPTTCPAAQTGDPLDEDEYPAGYPHLRALA